MRSAIGLEGNRRVAAQRGPEIMGDCGRDQLDALLRPARSAERRRLADAGGAVVQLDPDQDGSPGGSLRYWRAGAVGVVGASTMVADISPDRRIGQERCGPRAIGRLVSAKARVMVLS